MLLGVTGHRPDKLGGYSRSARKKLIAFAMSELTLLRPSISKVFTGMALGWDQAIAEACVELDIPFVALIPFNGQESIWPIQSQERYSHLMRRASEVELVCQGGYEPKKMLDRNIRLVNMSDSILALWNGTKGGTSHCVNYALESRKELNNAWPRWSDVPVKKKLGSVSSKWITGPEFVEHETSETPFVEDK